MKKNKQFFFNKKNQKAFIYKQMFYGSFFQKRTASFL